MRREALPFRRERFFDGPCPFRAWDFWRRWRLKRDRISIEVIGPEPGGNDPTRADAAIRSLARLIGRQIAREQFECKIALERKAQKKHPAGGDA